MQLLSSKIEEVKEAIISITTYDISYEFIVKTLNNIDLSDSEIVRTFLLGVSNLVRRFQKIDQTLYDKVLSIHQGQNEIQKGLAEDVIDDINIYVSLL
jgi:hypothetical protein